MSFNDKLEESIPIDVAYMSVLNAVYVFLGCRLGGSLNDLSMVFRQNGLFIESYSGKTIQIVGITPAVLDNGKSSYWFEVGEKGKAVILRDPSVTELEDAICRFLKNQKHLLWNLW